MLHNLFLIELSVSDAGVFIPTSILAIISSKGHCWKGRLNLGPRLINIPVSYAEKIDRFWPKIKTFQNKKLGDLSTEDPRIVSSKDLETEYSFLLFFSSLNFLGSW